ncbi:HK97-gp10 family putative phage morphogenesis protein [Brachybacterium hainanense]|uniref:HK97-gp10 family putative phage morphogenesis protein n=1 Tax=Brachybacterium hainanense TaxID=1541174 RepID=A0ABV6R992_9MICO
MTTDGSAEFEIAARQFGAAAREVMPRAREAMKKALNDIRAGAQARAPVDTGALRNSITTATQGNQDYAIGEVGPTVNYGGFVENGASQQRAQPYLRPATDAVIPGYEAALTRLGAEIIGGS